MKRLLDPPVLRALARGCAVLGAGGGGDTYLALLQALQATGDRNPVPLVDLDDLPDDSLIMPCGGIGAPTVSIEKIENGDEGERLRDHLEALTGRRVAALMASEIGGGNGLVPVAWAARMGLPVADADGMGRAFPETFQVTMHLAGISPSPAVMTDERGNLIVFRAISGHWIERMERAAAVEGDQVLVLQLEPEQPVGVITQPFDHHRTPHEPARGPPLDVHDFAGDQPVALYFVDQGVDGTAARVDDGLADTDRQRDRIPHRSRAGLRRGERVLGGRGHSAELHGRRPFQALHPLPGHRAEQGDVAPLVGHHGGARRDSG